MQELETLSMVLGNANVGVESINLDARSPTVRMVLLCPDLAYAERLVFALGEIEGSWVSGSGATYTNIRTAPGSPAAERPLKATITGRWTGRGQSLGRAERHRAYGDAGQARGRNAVTRMNTPGGPMGGTAGKSTHDARDRSGAARAGAVAD